MRLRKLVIVLLVLPGLLGPACGRSALAKTGHTTRAVISPDEASSFVEVDGVRIDIDNVLEFATTLGPEGLVHRIEGEVLDVRGGQLVLGDERYGAVQPQDAIRIGADGIHVNDVLRAQIP